jgi:hypothetical protein
MRRAPETYNLTIASGRALTGAPRYTAPGARK